MRLWIVVALIAMPLISQQAAACNDSLHCRFLSDQSQQVNFEMCVRVSQLDNVMHLGDYEAEWKDRKVYGQYMLLIEPDIEYLYQWVRRSSKNPVGAIDLICKRWTRFKPTN